jgi:hypothetical protein
MGTAVQADPREPADPEKIKFMIFFERCTWKHCNGYEHNGFSEHMKSLIMATFVLILNGWGPCPEVLVFPTKYLKPVSLQNQNC